MLFHIIPCYSMLFIPHCHYHRWQYHSTYRLPHPSFQCSADLQETQVTETPSWGRSKLLAWKHFGPETQFMYVGLYENIVWESDYRAPLFENLGTTTAPTSVYRIRIILIWHFLNGLVYAEKVATIISHIEYSLLQLPLVATFTVLLSLVSVCESKKSARVWLY